MRSPTQNPILRALTAAMCLAALSAVLFAWQDAAEPAEFHVVTQTREKGRQYFSYRVTWRFWEAGRVVLSTPRGLRTPLPGQHVDLTLHSQGFVRGLYAVDDEYRANIGPRGCTESVLMRADESNKRLDIRLHFHRYDGYGVSCLEEIDRRTGDLASSRETETAACTNDVLTALEKVRRHPLKVGEKTTYPVGNGKKFAQVELRALETERVETRAGRFPAVKYEASVFDDVLYRRDGHLYFWLTDDARRLPVKIQARFRFYIGTVTFELVSFDET